MTPTRRSAGLSLSLDRNLFRQLPVDVVAAAQCDHVGDQGKNLDDDAVPEQVGTVEHGADLMQVVEQHRN